MIRPETVHGGIPHLGSHYGPGATVRTTVFDTLFRVAVIVAVCEVCTLLVLTVNKNVSCPSGGTVAVGGTVTAGLSLESATVSERVPFGPVRNARPEVLWPPTTEARASCTLWSVAGLTAKVALLVKELVEATTLPTVGQFTP